MGKKNISSTEERKRMDCQLPQSNEAVRGPALSQRII